MRILRVNMSDRETSYEDLPEDWRILGGRGLSAKILSAEVPPATDPLGPEAKLIIAVGPLAGTLAPSCGRISVGAKSPLTLGIKEANAGGPVGQKMDRVGIRAIVVEGAPSGGDYHLLHVSKDRATLESADRYKGLKNYDLTEELYKDHDPKSSVISIGIGGERRWKSASVGFTDTDGRPTRHAARGGLGAVMGAKGLKAIVINDSGGSASRLAEKDAFREAVKGWPDVLKADKRLQILIKYGTSYGIAPLRALGSAPSKNYSSEPTEGYENLSGPAFEKTNLERGGYMKGCMPGCIVRCSTVYHDAEGKHLTSALEYETLALLGTNLGLADPDVVAKLDRLCDDMGLDTIEIGSALGVAASAGKMAFGDAESALALFDELDRGSEFGTILGNGVVSTCKVLGVTRIPAYKGQAMPGHDPRVTKATGVTYITSPMGADHTAGGTSYEDLESTEGLVERCLKDQILMATYDTLGYCGLARTEDTQALLGFLRDLINARYGLNLETSDLLEIGKETLRTELEFNKGAEFHSAHDPDPDFMRTEPLAPLGHVFDMDPNEISSIWEKLDAI